MSILVNLDERTWSANKVGFQQQAGQFLHMTWSKLVLYYVVYLQGRNSLTVALTKPGIKLDYYLRRSRENKGAFSGRPPAVGHEEFSTHTGSLTGIIRGFHCIYTERERASLPYQLQSKSSFAICKAGRVDISQPFLQHELHFFLGICFPEQSTCRSKAASSYSSIIHGFSFF